jgi:ABC-type amino acid transport substrate-binding protein
VEAFPTALNYPGSTRFNFIAGYNDRASMMLALERGEADAATIGLNSLYSLRRRSLSAMRRLSTAFENPVSRISVRRRMTRRAAGFGPRLG